MKREESEAKKQNFLELRVLQGKSYDSIARELQISKKTCINWAAELEDEINNLMADKFENLQQELELSRYKSMEYLCLLHNKIRDELNERDFKDVSTEKLIHLLFAVRNRININASFISDIVEDPFKNLTEPPKRVSIGI